MIHTLKFADGLAFYNGEIEVAFYSNVMDTVTFYNLNQPLPYGTVIEYEYIEMVYEKVNEYKKSLS